MSDLRAPQLTRDGLPARGDYEVCTTVDRPTTVALLIAKLHSETEEIARSLTDAEEYGDLLETLMSLAHLVGVDWGAVLQSQLAKRQRKGSLIEGNFWIPSALAFAPRHLSAVDPTYPTQQTDR